MPSKWRSPAVAFLDFIQPDIEDGQWPNPAAAREAYELCYCYLWSRARAIRRLESQGHPWGQPAFEMIVCLMDSLLSSFVDVLGSDPDSLIRSAVKVRFASAHGEDVEPGSLEHNFLSQAYVFAVTEPNPDFNVVLSHSGRRFSSPNVRPS